MSETPNGERHWADRAAEEILDRGVPSAVIATGISPSGPFHVGHLREILTGDAVLRALRDKGATARLVFVVDNVDPLRKVSPFLDRAVFEPMLGQPLFDIPAPQGPGHYDTYFLDPFLGALQHLRVDAEVLRANEFYASGRMNGVIFEALEARDRLARIMAEVTGREVDATWSAWNPRCSSCGRLDRGEVLGWDRAAGTVRSRCHACGALTERPVADGGKLTWRVDWPARWKALGVTAEPFGKDHASQGGSYDTGVRIAREVFGIEPPHPMVYEWIALKGQGDMSSSKGNVLSIAEMLEVVPPEVLRYLVMKTRPTRSISFDPGAPLLRLVDEVDDAEAGGRDDRALALSRAAGFRPVGVPFHHLVLVAQIGDFDLDRVIAILEQGGYVGFDRETLARRLTLARGWLDRFAPEEEKVRFPETLPARVSALTAEQKAYLGRLAEAMEGLDGAHAATIHARLYDLARAEGGPGPKAAFEAIYAALLGRDRGPRAATFIEALGVERARARFAEASRA